MNDIRPRDETQKFPPLANNGEAPDFHIGIRLAARIISSFGSANFTSPLITFSTSVAPRSSFLSSS